MLDKVIISAPFGNYLNFDKCTSTIGTYTADHRAGWLKRWWRVLSTVRYNRRTQSWTNRLGLPNPGICGLDANAIKGKILSIHGFTADEWKQLIGKAIEYKATAVELNLSCPNVDKSPELIRDVSYSISMALQHIPIVIAKLPPIRWLEFAIPLYHDGIRCFHLCNTIPTPAGGMSGKPLMQYSLWAISDLRRVFGNTVRLIGGGGIASVEDALQYVRASADHVALGSMMFNPFNWKKVPQIVNALKDLK